MGGVVDGGVGIGLKTSPCRAAIEKAQAELRQEYDVREERRRELEFLEKGGNPLDFKFGNAASVSVQSTSHTDRHPEHFVSSEAKGSFALMASPCGDSVESSGKPGAPTVCEPNSADNLLLFDGENELPEGERKLKHYGTRNKIAPSEQSSQLDGSQSAKETEDSAIFRPYARRNRSRTNRDGARSSSTDVIQSRCGQTSSLLARGISRDLKGSVSETNNQKDQSIPSVSNPKAASTNGDIVSRISTCDGDLDIGLDSAGALEITIGTQKESLLESKLNNSASKSTGDNHQNQAYQVTIQETSVEEASRGPNLIEERKRLDQVHENASSSATKRPENETSYAQLNGVSVLKGDGEMLNGDQNGNLALGTKGLDSESSCNPICLDVKNGMCSITRNIDSNGNATEQTSAGFGQTPNQAGGNLGKEKEDTGDSDSGPIVNEDHNSLCQNLSANRDLIKDEIGIHISRPSEVKYSLDNNGNEPNDITLSISDGKKVGNVLVGNSIPHKESFHADSSQGILGSCKNELPETTSSGMRAAATSDPQACADINLKLVEKAREDSILEESRVIKAKRKRIAELAICTLPLETRRKSHWDFVLEEMAWLASDFAQERLWKINAAAQICRRAAFTSRLRAGQQTQISKLKEVAHISAKAVMQFWSSAELLLDSDDHGLCHRNSNNDLPGSRKDVGNGVSENKTGEPVMETRKESELHPKSGSFSLAVQTYAMRFLKYNKSLNPQHTEAPKTPERVSDSGILDVSWEDHFTEETLFYATPLGAMDVYRKSIESHFVQDEEEVETSMYDAVTENACDEDEAETSTHYLSGRVEVSKLSKFSQKKQKNSMNSSYGRPYEMGADLHHGHCTTVTQQSTLMGKRPSSVHIGSIPTKRMRTASRQRFISPFNSGAAAVSHAQVKTDASSGETNSFQDDLSTLHGGSQMQKSVEVESAGDFDKQLPYDSAETSVRSKKRKKAKYQGSTYDQGWQLDSTIHNEQRDISRKRLENHHFESNGASGLYGQAIGKKPKIVKQSLENTFDNINPMTGSIPSPVASQMSNMSNTNRFIKLIGGRDRRKAKAPKMSAGQLGSGSPWSVFEDQALVVLVHDMGPNWELVSDAINSTLQFKHSFRKPQECKERHKILMDKSPGDGADSAEDSGSSQPYPSTLPGIPKGSARQLFQRLQEPMEEDTLKSHFEKIIKIGQKLQGRRIQDAKQLVPVHNSHVIALSQVCPNNLNGGVLTPLDLCDATASSPDVISHGYHSPHATGMAVSNHNATASMLPSSGANSSLHGSSAMVIGSNLSSPPAPHNSSIRDSRYSIPRTSALPVDEQQRMQQYNQLLSGRNFAQSNSSAPVNLPGNERGVRMLPGGNSMGTVCGGNRSMPIPRPGFQGMASSSIMNSGSMLSSSMVGMPSPVNMHSGAGSGQGNSMLRPREALHMLRPGHISDNQRQMMIPELQVQATQGNSQGVPPFNGLSSAFPNQTTSPTIQAYPGHPQSQRQMSPKQALSPNSPHHTHLQASNHASAGSLPQTYPVRFPKERQQQQQQRYLQQPQQQQQQQLFPASNALMPNVQPQPQLPPSPTLQNNSPQLHPQTSSQPVSLSPITPSSPMTPSMSTQHQLKHHLPPHGLSRNAVASGLNNQVGKQRQRQPQQFQQSGRHHPQQRQLAQSQQQAKILKGVGRSNMLVHQNLSINSSHLNGLSMPPGSQSIEKGEQIMQSMQGQGLYSGSNLNTVQPSKPYSSHSQLQQKILSGSAPPAKQVQMTSHSDTRTQGQVPHVPSSHVLAASNQAVLPAVMASNHQQSQVQPQTLQKEMNQTQQSVQRMLQQNRQGNSESPSKGQGDITHDGWHLANNTSQMGTDMAMSHTCVDSENAVPALSHRKSSEPVYDSRIPCATSQSVSIENSNLTNSVGSEPPPMSQGLGPRQLSGGLPGSQWQEMPFQQSSTQLLPSQQQEQPQSHQSPQHHQPVQEQLQHLHAAQSNLCMKPANSKLE